MGLRIRDLESVSPGVTHLLLHQDDKVMAHRDVVRRMHSRFVARAPDALLPAAGCTA